MNPNTPIKTTPAYLVQSIISFAVAMMVVVLGEMRLPVEGWTRAFLGIGTLFLVSSSFTLAKVIRDQHESENVVSRIDQARLERLLAEFDPYRLRGPAGVPGRSDGAAGTDAAPSPRPCELIETRPQPGPRPSGRAAGCRIR